MLDAEFWARFAASKEPGEHTHHLMPNGLVVHCNLPTEAECEKRWDLMPCDDCGRTIGHNMEVEH